MIIGLIKRTFSSQKYYYRLLYRLFGVTPNNLEIYKLALVHRSASVVDEQQGGYTLNNERLEFLGDAVIEAVVSEMLFIDFPQMNEGEMTKLRSRIVSRESLNSLAVNLGLNNEIIALPSSLNSHNQNLYGDAMEALIGALYLDQGYNRTNRILITRLLDKNIDIEQMTQTENDFKSRIIEWAQKHHKKIEFKTSTARDYTESNPNFETILRVVNGENLGYGSGHSKKESEQRAARQAYDNLGL